MEVKVKLNESPQTDNTLSTLISSAEQAGAYESIAKSQCQFLPPKAPKPNRERLFNSFNNLSRPKSGQFDQSELQTMMMPVQSLFNKKVVKTTVSQNFSV